jgi:hypothetical protein
MRTAGEGQPVSRQQVFNAIFSPLQHQLLVS